MKSEKLIGILWFSFIAGLIGLGTYLVNNHFDFASPKWLWLLLPIAAFGYVFVWLGKSGQVQMQFSKLPGHGSPLLVQFTRHFLLGIRLLALGAIVIVAARPQSSKSYENLTREGINIVLALDVSGSMLSQDFEPNRLESAKATAIDFIDSRPNDRIGVVVYEGESITQVPLTTDHRVVKNTLSEVRTGLLEPGTAIGLGLSTAVNRLREAEGESHVVILLTDGVNNMGQIEPLDAAQLAELYGIRVYTIGVGTIGKARSPVGIRNGQYVFDWVEVEIDEEILHDIADLTGGKYFRATSASKLENIYAEIDQLEKTRFDVMQYHRKKEEYPLFLLLGIGLLLIEFLLSVTLFRSAL